jgi:hypothetical protein
MLHLESIDAKTLELLKRLISLDVFKDLRLVGGTSLALQLGHRKSVDINLFGELNADEFEISKALSQFNQVNVLHQTKSIRVYSINGIKTDIVNFPYPWLMPSIIEDDIVLAQIIDIAAMKLAAVAGRGTKKDFIDIYFILQQMSLAEMIEQYLKKYYDGSVFIVLKSLTYFNDAEIEEMPVMLIPTDWEDVKTLITEKVVDYQINPVQG